MSLGCGGSTDDFRLGTGDYDKAVTFRLEPAKASACKPLVKWRKSH